MGQYKGVSPEVRRLKKENDLSDIRRYQREVMLDDLSDDTSRSDGGKHATIVAGELAHLNAMQRNGAKWRRNSARVLEDAKVNAELSAAMAELDRHNYYN